MEWIGKVYGEMFRLTGHDWPARNAAVAAWRERHPTVKEEDADLAVARLIVEAIVRLVIRLALNSRASHPR